MRHIHAAIRLLGCGAFFFGVVYPLCVWIVSHSFFHHQAEGCPVYEDGQFHGFLHIGQSFQSDRYFWGRPSKTVEKPYNTLYSGGSNLSFASSELRKDVLERKEILQKALSLDISAIPEELYMASASGLDPEISLKAALVQVPRIAKVRGASEEFVEKIVLGLKEKKTAFCFSSCLNVLELNIELDNQLRDQAGK